MAADLNPYHPGTAIGDNQPEAARRSGLWFVIGGIVITLTCAGVIAFVMIMIVPKAEKIHSNRRTEVPADLQSAINLSRHVEEYWYVWAIAFAGGLGLIEWKCKRENKPLIRRVIAVGVSAVSIVLVIRVVRASMAAWMYALADLRSLFF